MTAVKSFEVEPAVWDRFPGLRLPVAVGRGLDLRTAVPAVTERWRATWAGASRHAQQGSPQAHPLVRPWRERFSAMGVSGKQFPSSVEALLRRAMKGGEPFAINPLVDFYNTVSLEFLVPAGGFDLADVRQPLELRLTRAGDRFQALDSDAAEVVAPGEVAYASGAEVLTRHFVWRQSRRALVGERTSDAFLVAEVLPECGPDAAAAVLDAFAGGLRAYFGVEPVAFIVDQGTPAPDDDRAA